MVSRLGLECEGCDRTLLAAALVRAKEIAQKPAISVKSVQVYRARLTEKFDLTSRGEIVCFALHHGWLNEG